MFFHLWEFLFTYGNFFTFVIKIVTFVVILLHNILCSWPFFTLFTSLIFTYVTKSFHTFIFVGIFTFDGLTDEDSQKANIAGSWNLPKSSYTNRAYT